QNVAEAPQLPALPLQTQWPRRMRRRVCCGRRFRAPRPATGETRIPRTPPPVHASVRACAPPADAGSQPIARFAEAADSAEAFVLPPVFALQHSSPIHHADLPNTI